VIPSHRVGGVLGIALAVIAIVNSVVWWRRKEAAGRTDRLDVAVARVLYLAVAIIILLFTLLFIVYFELET